MPEALANSVQIARRCSLVLKLGQARLPHYPVPDGMTTEEFLRTRGRAPASQRALGRAWPQPSAGRAIASACELELNVICQMGFAGYFLIVADFIRWARENGVPVGPGRGSGAGSLVAYAWGSPTSIRCSYDLLFERFLNPERVSMPDFDVDFCMDGRDRVIDYVAQQVRPRARLADHHLRHHGRQGRGARCRPRARACLRLRRPDRQADPLRARHHAR